MSKYVLFIILVRIPLFLLIVPCMLLAVPALVLCSVANDLDEYSKRMKSDALQTHEL